MRQGLGIGVGVVVLVLLAGCAAKPPVYPTSGVVIWRSGHASLPRNLAEAIQAIFDRLQRRAGVEARLVINGSHIPNAYALVDDQGPAVYLNAGMIDLFGYDRDATAFVLAHELSHLGAGHLSARGRERLHRQDGAAQLLGTVADFFVPLSGLVVEAGNAMLKAGYSRDQEREADAEGLKLMMACGFDPAGGIRFQRRMLAIADPGMPFFATHPQGAERIEQLQALIDQTR